MQKQTKNIFCTKPLWVTASVDKLKMKRADEFRNRKNSCVLGLKSINNLISCIAVQQTKNMLKFK